MPLIEICRRLWGQQIHCSEGATSESDSFDLSMVLVSNKLTSNRGYLVWLGAICAGIINWPNSGIYGKTCALSLLKLFVEAKRAVQGSCLNLLWLSTRMMNFQGESIITFLMNTLQRWCFFHFKSRLFLICMKGTYCKQKPLHYACLNTSVTLQSIKTLSWTAISSFSPDAQRDHSFSLKTMLILMENGFIRE